MGRMEMKSVLFIDELVRNCVPDVIARGVFAMKQSHQIQQTATLRKLHSQ
jgi:hypothetical protein